MRSDLISPIRTRHHAIKFKQLPRPNHLKIFIRWNQHILSIFFTQCFDRELVINDSDNNITYIGHSSFE